MNNEGTPQWGEDRIVEFVKQMRRRGATGEHAQSAINEKGGATLTAVARILTGPSLSTGEQKGWELVAECLEETRKQRLLWFQFPLFLLHEVDVFVAIDGVSLLVVNRQNRNDFRKCSFKRLTPGQKTLEFSVGIRNGCTFSPETSLLELLESLYKEAEASCRAAESKL